MTSGYWPARLGELPSLRPCAPWHMLHCWTAMVPPRPAASPAPARPMAGVITTLVMRASGLGHSFSRVVHSLGTPAARQMLSHRPLALKSRMLGRQPHEADEDGECRQHAKPEHAAPEPRVAPGEEARGLVHQRPPIGTTGTEAFFERRQLRDRKAVVHDRQRDHQRHPQPEAVQRHRRRRRHVHRRAEGVGRGRRFALARIAPGPR